MPPETPPSSARRSGTGDAFELIQQIGEGAFGDVYRARDALHRDVALKLLRHVSGRSAEQQAARILHEGRVLARVRHPSVVTVYGAEEHDGRVGLWMEFIEGRTLEALLRSQGSFGAREAALIGRELCRALAAVHGAGLVHRDIKAQNVMREAGGRLVLMDFGAGQIMQEEARTGGRVTGTPLYLAPELLRGAPASVPQRHLQPGRPSVSPGHRRLSRPGDESRRSAAGARDGPASPPDRRPARPSRRLRARRPAGARRAIRPNDSRAPGEMADALSQTLTADSWGDATRGRRVRAA